MTELKLHDNCGEGEVRVIRLPKKTWEALDTIAYKFDVDHATALKIAIRGFIESGAIMPRKKGI